MKTHVEFRSDCFGPYEGEDDEINPGRWGKRLAEFLFASLPAHGLVTEEIYAEDWGWAVPVENKAFPIWIGCGNYEEYPNGFLVFVEPSSPTVRKGLFKKVETVADVTKVTTAIDAVLKSNPEITDIRWWDEEENPG